LEDDLLMLDDVQGETARGREALLILMDRIVREEGPMQAASKLGVNYKTLAAAQETRRLSRRMTHALELRLLSEDNPIFQLHEERLTVLDDRLAKVEGVVKEIVAGSKQLRTTIETHGAEQDRAIRVLERKISGDSSAQQARPTGAKRTKSARRGRGVTSITSIEAPQKQTRPTFPRRNYDDIVTVEPANDDSYVYRKAWPLVREWRMLQRNHSLKGRTLTWLERQERLLIVELVLLNEYKLTLPPDDKPIDDHWRRHITKWRLDDLRVVRRRIFRRKMLRWVRRLATFGVWWG